MMLPTHVVVGMAVAVPIAFVAPELAPPALTGAIVGSTLPDADMYAGHRRTLHYPTLYSVAAALSSVGAVFVAHPWLVGLAFLLLGAAIHCRMDRYGGGLSLRPWERTSDRAVYDHVRQQWRAPKRWIRYDGAPEDVILLVVLAIPLWLLVPDPYRLIVGLALLVGIPYGIFRRRLAEVAAVVFTAPPAAIRRHVPQRYKE